jgi:triosephosphate isomerase (TIM)
LYSNRMKPLIIANWKMSLGVDECAALAAYCRTYVHARSLVERIDLVLCPPTISLSSVAHECFESPVRYGAQNVFWHEKGAYTGETAPSNLIEIGCTHVILGHSERRKYVGETDEMVNRKVAESVTIGLIPVICVGETFNQRHDGKSDLVVMTQVIEALRGLDLTQGRELIIAYEPVWVIGTVRLSDRARHSIWRRSSSSRSLTCTLKTWLRRRQEYFMAVALMRAISRRLCAFR